MRLHDLNDLNGCFHRVIFFLIVVLLSLRTTATPLPNSDEYFVYIGTYTEDGSSSKGIYVYRFNSKTQKLTSIGLAAPAINPSFLAIDPDHRFLYAVNEVGNYQGKKSGAVSAFAIDPSTGKLKLLNQVPTGGADPCYISVDASGKFVLVANYTGGSIAVFPILKDGRLGDASAFIQHTGHGTNPQRQEGPHAHSIDLSPDNRFAIVDDLGLDETFVYKFDPANGSLALEQDAGAKADTGAGPRHFTFGADGRFAYVLSEMSSTICVLSYQASDGVLKRLQTISTLPKDFKGHNDAAEIQMHPSGKFLYASNRGHDSIAVFKVDPSKGTLSLTEYTATKGSSPRNFTVDPTGSLLLVGNEKSDNIVVFRINRTTGRLTPTGAVLEIPQPVCIRFMAAK
jgi:6-phosphogluconolactonase